MQTHPGAEATQPPSHPSSQGQAAVNGPSAPSQGPSPFQGDLSGPAVALAGVSAAYGKKAEDVLRGITFEARAGAVASIYGPAGAGKSALMDVLRLALPPAAGTARILGAEAGKLSLTARARLKRRIGWLGQTPLLVDHLNAFENTALPLRLAGLKPVRYANDVEELLAFVGMSKNDDRPVSQLSGSERRRIAAARAVVAQPKLLLADEPCAGLSPDLAGRVMRLLVSMRRAGAAIVVTTQDEALAQSLAGSHWRMADGRIALAGERAA